MADKITINGRVLGLDRKPDSVLLRSTMPRFQEAYTIVPDGQLAESDQFTEFGTPTLYQIQNGCVGHGGASAVWNCFAANGVVPPPDLSPTWLYAQTNGGRDQGASIGDLLDATQTAGCCLASSFPEAEYFLSQATNAAKEEAQSYRIDDGYLAYTWGEVMTALHHGYQVADSVMVGNDFMSRLGSVGGISVVPDDRGMGNHCVVSGGILRFGGVVYRRRKTSWGTQTPLGPEGIFLTTKAHDDSQGQGFSAVVFRTVKAVPGTPTPPVPVAA